MSATLAPSEQSAPDLGAMARLSAGRRARAWPPRVLGPGLVALLWVLRFYVAAMLALVAWQSLHLP